MAQLTATPDELLAVVEELFPREHQIALLTLVTRKQAARIAELEDDAGACSGTQKQPAGQDETEPQPA